jgi:hypothetical protein
MMSKRNTPSGAISHDEHGQSQKGLVDFLRHSRVADAVAMGELPPDAFDRKADLARNISLDAQATAADGSI